MAHENCKGDGDKKWTSTFFPASGGEEDDGKIRIFEESNQLKGKHEKSGNDLEDLSCDGVNISFNRKGTKDGKTIRVFYKNGKISGPTGGFFFIHGKYKEEVLERNPRESADMDRDESETRGRPESVDNDTGDWQAERPVA